MENPLLGIPSRVRLAPRVGWEGSLATRVRGGEGKPQAQLCRTRSAAPAPAALTQGTAWSQLEAVGELNPSCVTG